MKKRSHFLCVCLLAFLCYYCGTVLADRQVLTDQWIRVHVVANSDSGEDQALKLRVRDAVLEALQDAALGTDGQTRLENLRERLPRLRDAAQRVLMDCGSTDRAMETLEQEAFPQRESGSLRLPAGVYQTLRVTIGEGQGHNWWGVLFPDLCYGEEENVSASLVSSLTREGEIRFFLLEKLGQLENKWKERWG